MEKRLKDHKALLDVAVLAVIVLAARMILEKFLPLFYQRFGLYFSDFLFQTLSNYPLTIAMVVADFLLVSLLIKKISYGSGSMMIRTLIELGGIFVISFIASIILRVFQISEVGGSAPLFDKLFWFTLITNLLFNSVIVMVMDVISYYRWLHKKALAEEIEKRSKANYQYQLLKLQTNPHFLFNSLNVLDYLIQTDPNKASDYLKRLADLYRYILKIESEQVVRLEEETAFVKLYVNLLYERFGSAIFFSIYIPEKLIRKKIIPCGLQMLVENAVKHNVLNAANVLKIEIFTEGDFVIVRNNIQKKIVTTPTTGLGLKNIQKQYEILFGSEIEIINDGKTFEVKIPIFD